jgi:hypothetical protein
MAALKHQVDVGLGRRLAAELVAAWPAFPRRGFTSGLADALEPLELAGPQAADVVVDYRVHYVGARGVKAPRVFKLARRRLQPGRPVTIRREHPFDHVSIRRIHPGLHGIDIQVNGRVLGSAAVEITPAR